MDEEIAKWIIEFLIRQNIDDRIINALIGSLTLPKDDVRLGKALLLRRIGSEVTDGSVSEAMLEAFEMVEELDHAEGKGALESMKSAYCAVAVDCTVRFLDEAMENNDKYVAVAKRIWEEKVGKMEKAKFGLVSESLLRWKQDILSAILESDVRSRILLINTRKEALKAVNGYLTEAWRNIGPSFLELVAKNRHKTEEEAGEKVSGGKTSWQIVVYNGQAARHEATVTPNVNNDEVDGKFSLPRDDHAIRNEEIQEQLAPSACQQSALGSMLFGGDVHGSPGGIRTEFEDEDLSMNVLDKLSTPAVNKVHESLKRSVADLRAIVRDPLPEALLVAKAIASNLKRDKAGKKGLEEVGASGSGLEGTQIYRDNLVNKNSERDSPHPLLPPDDNSSMESPRALVVRPHLSSPKRKISPLRKLEVVKFVRRKNRIRWSRLEEDTLRAGVQEFGRGNWKLILRTQRSHSSVRHKNAARRSILMLRSSRKPKIADDGCPYPPEEFRMQVKGCASPLEEVQTVENVAAEKGAENSNVQSTGVNSSMDADIDVDRDEVQKRNGDNATHTQNNLSKASLMERNSTARTYRWEDSAEDSLGTSPIKYRLPDACAIHQRLQSPKKRRVKKRWSKLEEDALRDGVVKYGKGNWKVILDAFRDVFEERTEVDLKDKWRNLTK